MNEKQISLDQELLNRKNEVIQERELFTDKEAVRFLRISQITLWRIRKTGKNHLPARIKQNRLSEGRP